MHPIYLLVLRPLAWPSASRSATRTKSASPMIRMIRKGTTWAATLRWCWCRLACGPPQGRQDRTRRVTPTPRGRARPQEQWPAPRARPLPFLPLTNIHAGVPRIRRVLSDGRSRARILRDFRTLYRKAIRRPKACKVPAREGLDQPIYPQRRRGAAGRGRPR